MKKVIGEVAILIAILMNGIAIYSLSQQNRELWLRVQILEAREVMGRKLSDDRR